MAEDYIYNGKPLSSMDLWALGALLDHLTDQEDRRMEASKNKKFNKKMPFPPPNPKFIELKNAVEAEIRKKQNV